MNDFESRKRPSVGWSHGRPAGWMTADAVIALVIVALLSGLMALSVHRAGRADRHLDDTVDAGRTVERAVLSIQTGQLVERPAVVKVLTTPAPAGWQWVQVTAVVGEGRAALTALVPVNGVIP